MSVYERGPASPLRVQEKKVLALLAHGQTNKEIASALRISFSIVKRHVENILISST